MEIFIGVGVVVLWIALADVDFATLRCLDLNEQRLSAEFGRPEDR